MVNGQRFRLVTSAHGPTHLVEVDGVAHRVSHDEGGVVRAPAPALVVATPWRSGAEVEAGAPVLVLESMKMETVLRAPFRARLRECLVAVGSQVEAGEPLLRLEPLGAGDDAVAGQDSPATGRTPRRRRRPARRARRRVSGRAGRGRIARPARAAARLTTLTRRTGAGCWTVTSWPGPRSGHGNDRPLAGEIGLLECSPTCSS